MKDQSNDKFQVNKITDGISILLDQFTCTATERAFLDEIREKGKYRANIGCVYIPGTASELYARDFKSALQELVNE